MRDLQSLSVSSANGAPLHLIRFERSARSRQAQAISMFAHAAVVVAVLFAATHSHAVRKALGESEHTSLAGPLTFIPPPEEFGTPSLGLNGSGGGKNPVPTTAGNLPRLSSMPLMPPRLPDSAHHILSVPVTVFDADAPQFPAPVNDVGLPWMKDRTDSPGPGNSNTIGGKNGRSVGDDDGTRAGRSDRAGPYSNVMSAPACAYCPDPQYTDEAREVKMQGSVTLLALVGADGRAAEIRLERGLGYGLDERAIQTVRTWRFVPARDGARRPVPAWVTIEAVYRLF